MAYLYGDSTDSPFTSNVLEFLRDAIDFCVYVLEADQRIRACNDHAKYLRQQAQGALHEIDDLAQAVAKSIEATSKGATDSPAARCATDMAAACAGVVESSSAAVRQQLTLDLAQAEKEEASEREGCRNALMTVLIAHRPPNASSITRIHLLETGRYRAWEEGSHTGLGLTWKCELAFPAEHPFNQSLRVDNVQKTLDVHAPELSGWIKKEVKVRPQHLERYTINEVEAEDSKIVLRLRTEPGSDVGFDLAWDPEAGRIAASRIGDDPSAGPFDVEEADAPKLIALCQSVQKSLTEAKRDRLLEAKLGDVDFHTVPTFVDPVESLVRELSPMVQEIARHSLEPDELVLRWKISGDRREEIFVSKKTLREKYEHLPGDLRTLFEPLGLHTSLSRSLAPLGTPEAPSGTVRSELPRSHPPPKPKKKPEAVAIPPESTPFAAPPEDEIAEADWDVAAGGEPT